MRKLFLIMILFQSIIYANDTDLILNEIKQLRSDMNKRFEAVDKRFEQVDKRFEAMQSNMDKRFETVFTILYILMGLVFASPFIAIYLRDKKEIEDKKNFDIIKGMLFVLKEFAQDNEKVAKSLRSAGLM